MNDRGVSSPIYMTSFIFVDTCVFEDHGCLHSEGLRSSTSSSQDEQDAMVFNCQTLSITSFGNGTRSKFPLRYRSISHQDRLRTSSIANSTRRPPQISNSKSSHPSVKAIPLRSSHHTFVLMSLTHPEHYGLPSVCQEDVINMIGERMARTRIEVASDVPLSVMECGYACYRMKKATIHQVNEETVPFYILHETETQREDVITSYVCYFRQPLLR